MKSIIKPIKLTRQDGKIVDVTFYNNSDIENVEILDIKKLKFEGKKNKRYYKNRYKRSCF